MHSPLAFSKVPSLAIASIWSKTRCSPGQALVFTRELKSTRECLHLHESTRVRFTTIIYISMPAFKKWLPFCAGGWLS